MLEYKEALGTTEPSDIMTKNVLGEVLDKHLGTLGAEMRDGRAEAAPELNSLGVVSWVQWLDGDETVRNPRHKTVTFPMGVQFRVIPHANVKTAARNPDTKFCGHKVHKKTKSNTIAM